MDYPRSTSSPAFSTDASRRQSGVLWHEPLRTQEWHVNIEFALHLIANISTRSAPSAEGLREMRSSSLSDFERANAAIDNY